MPRIVLLGDSIRMSYAPLVCDQLAGVAEVIHPRENCANSFNLREHLSEWAIDLQPDIVHFNAGIHDLGWMPDEVVPRFTTSAYARNLRIIVDRLQRHTTARLVFATTTPFRCPDGRGGFREATIVDRYNRAATAAMAAKGVAINDLHAIVKTAGLDACLDADRLHMNPHGREVLAAAVVRTLSPLIADA